MAKPNRQRSQPQEYLPTIKPPGQQNGQADLAQRQQEIAKSRGNSRIKERLYVAAEKPRSDTAKAHDVLRQVKRDGVHPNPYERLAPRLDLEHIDHPVEDPKQDGAVPARDQDKRRGPNL